MKERLLHTPEGVRDIYNDECAQKKELISRIEKVFHSYGYRDIETPTMEYFDVFGYEIGTIPSRELFKFFDREGDTMVLRPDFTPSIARACSKYFLEDKQTIRLCYEGNTFVNHSSLQGRLRESTQTGVELIGDESADADAEIIAMVIESLKNAGLSDFQITLGHVGYFSALVRDAGLDEETQEQLKDLIRNRNVFGVEKMISLLDLDERKKKALTGITALFGGGDVLDEAMKMTQCEKALEAVSRLKEVWEILKLYGAERYVSFDLGMMSSYAYYTGIIFRGYTYAVGEPVVKGGRYDRLLSFFGKDAPAIGFVVVASQLLAAMNRQQLSAFSPEKRILICYEKENRPQAIEKARELRREGKNVTLCGKGLVKDPAFDEIICI